MIEERTLLRGRIPKHFVDQFDAWEEHGVLPSGILRPILSNDLIGTFVLALGNLKVLSVLPDLVVYTANHLPAEAWGSLQVLDSWRGRQSRSH